MINLRPDPAVPVFQSITDDVSTHMLLLFKVFVRMLNVQNNYNIWNVLHLQN